MSKPVPQPGAPHLSAAGIAALAEIDRLVDEEQKVQTAYDQAIALLESARKAGDEPLITRALIKAAKLKTGLSGYETAVRFLREQKWPRGKQERAVLDLSYGAALVSYLSAYSWEIRQRERVTGTETVDLSAWTHDQIAGEAIAAYARAWSAREVLGALPVRAWAEFLTVNDYPRGVRGTLRDAVTYLFAGLLADSSLWSPGEQNGTWRLVSAALVADSPPAVPLGDSTAGPAVHPLSKLVSVLADLEAWHRRGGRKAAELEAWLARVRHLSTALDTTADRALLTEQLRTRLKDPKRGYRSVSWWAFGQAALAERVRQEERPDALIEARNIALVGWKAYPGSPGGAACRRIVREIEAPDLSAQSMASDGAKRRSLQVRHRNLAALYLRAYRLDLGGWIRHGGAFPLSENAEAPANLLGRSSDLAWSVQLPGTPDFRDHTTYVTPPLAQPGVYAILISAREDFRPQGNRLLSVRLLVGELVLASRGVEQGKLAVLALDGNSGKGLAGAVVGLYRGGRSAGDSVRVATLTAGDDGFVRFPEPGSEAAPSGEGEKAIPWFSREYFLVGEKGESVAFTDLGWMQPDSLAVEASNSLVFTDRAVYRPGQKVLWKVLAYRGRSGDEPRLLPGADVKITLTDPQGAEAGSATVTTNAYGTASGEFAIPVGRTLGAWSLSTAFGDEGGGDTSIQVEEYKRPTFEVVFDAPIRETPPLRLNRPAKVTGTARYLFGLPVTGGDGVQATWAVTREPVYPDWWGYWGWRPRGGGSERVAAGESNIGADGTFTVAFTPEADEREARDVSYRFRISAAVTDEGGETREAESSYRIGFVAIEAALESERTFFESGRPTEPNGITVVRKDLDGAPRAGRGSWRLLALRQPERPLLPSEEPILSPPGAATPAAAEPTVTPGDRLRPRWEPYGGFERTLRRWDDGEEVAHGELNHGEDGRASVDLPALEPGAYRLRYLTVDDFGARAEAQGEWIVVGPAGSREGATLPPLPIAALLAVETSTVRVGETARLLVHSGFPGQGLIFEIYQSGRLRERRRLVAEDHPIRIDLPVGPADRGGLFFRLFALRDFQSLESSLTLEVPWDDRELSVELSSFRDRIRPGDRESWKVVVRDTATAGSKGDQGDDSRAPVAAAELLASMYDRSLDAFAPYDPPSVLGLFPRRIAEPGGARLSLGVNGARFLADDDLVNLPDTVEFQEDALLQVGSYSLGGPGWRGRRMMSMMAATAPGEPVAEAIIAMSADAPMKSAVESSSPVAPAPPPPPPPAPPAAPIPLRSSFAETAFWQPHLLTGADGSAGLEFTVPDSLTSWNVWVHAITRDFRSGSVHAETRSSKALMVRPYLPRFLREGDRAEIRAVVNFSAVEAGDVPLSGEVRLELVDGATQQDRLAAFGLNPATALLPFAVEPGGGATVVFPIVVPKEVGEVEFRITARSAGPEGALSDGELRALPILPSRLHLAQSRFAALRGNESRTLEFADLAKPDPTRTSEQMVVTLDAQLFYGVLDALPYLIDYPYECTEQTLNRFLSTGIVRSLFDRYPAVAEMAAQMATRETATEPWSVDDPNRRMLLEETPWLAVSKGGRGGRDGDGEHDLIRVLDPKIAEAQRNASLAKLGEAQLSSGAFPWWPGGPASDYMTIYLLAGFARATEFGVEVPRELVEKGWSYLGGRYRNEWAAEVAKKDGCCIELLTLLNYVASSYPDPSWMAGALDPADRARIADHSFAKWREHSPYLKGLLALTLHRMDREADAKLVFDSVMDSARTTRDEGTFWQPEERSWLWYQDTVESHAFALRTLLELSPEDSRLPGLVQWIFLQKKLGHWQSTRATAEVLYSLASYLKKVDQLGTREAATVAVSGVPQGTTRFVFEPDRYTGKHNQIVIPGAAIDAASAASAKGGQVTVTQETPGLMFASATWHFATDQLPTQASGDLFHIERHYFKRLRGGTETTLEPLGEDAALAVGDEIEVQLTLSSRAPAEYVHLRDPRAAGFEPGVVRSGYTYDLGLGRYEATRDAATDFFFEYLPVGTYTLKYRLRANVAGTFRVGPATLQSLYAPEFVAYSAGAVVRVVGVGE